MLLYVISTASACTCVPCMFCLLIFCFLLMIGWYKLYFLYIRYIYSWKISKTMLKPQHNLFNVLTKSIFTPHLLQWWFGGAVVLLLLCAVLNIWGKWVKNKFWDLQCCCMSFRPPRHVHAFPVCFVCWFFVFYWWLVDISFISYILGTYIHENFQKPCWSPNTIFSMFYQSQFSLPTSYSGGLVVQLPFYRYVPY